MSQWRDELLSHTQHGALAVAFYYGPDRIPSTDYLRYRERKDGFVVDDQDGGSRLATHVCHCQEPVTCLTKVLAVCVGCVCRGVDVVLTTYGTLASEWSSYSSLKGPSHEGLYALHWTRVILDEAHSIKNKVPHSTQAVDQQSSQGLVRH